jgi:hypothetical protein
MDLPGCSQVGAVMNLTNQMNVPFDNYGYLQAKTQCVNEFSPFKKTLLPEWPVKNAKLYPTQDLTSEEYPLKPEFSDVNLWENIVENWPPAPVYIEPKGPQLPDGPWGMQEAQNACPQYVEVHDMHTTRQKTDSSPPHRPCYKRAAALLVIASLLLLIFAALMA